MAVKREGNTLEPMTRSKTHLHVQQQKQQQQQQQQQKKKKPSKRRSPAPTPRNNDDGVEKKEQKKQVDTAPQRKTNDAQRSLPIFEPAKQTSKQKEPTTTKISLLFFFASRAEENDHDDEIKANKFGINQGKARKINKVSLV